jgi:hypothetical protein
MFLRSFRSLFFFKFFFKFVFKHCYVSSPSVQFVAINPLLLGGNVNLISRHPGGAEYAEEG